MATWGIHHTSLVVSDVDKALRFYRDGLGLELVGDVEEQTERLAQQVEVPGAWIRCMWLKTLTCAATILAHLTFPSWWMTSMR